MSLRHADEPLCKQDLHLLCHSMGDYNRGDADLVVSDYTSSKVSWSTATIWWGMSMPISA